MEITIKDDEVLIVKHAHSQVEIRVDDWGYLRIGEIAICGGNK